MRASPNPPRRLPWRWLIGCLPVVLVMAGVGLALMMWSRQMGRLTGISLPGFIPPICGLTPATTPRPGLAATMTVNWVIEEDVVSVLNTLQRQGWQITTHMTRDVKLLPAEPIALDLWIVQVRVLRGISLAYTETGTANMEMVNTMIVCGA